jgi:ferrous iron transport protein A
MNLENAPLASAWRVKSVVADPRHEERARQLEEIGFLPGELVSVMTRAVPGGDPLVVRVGLSTFALRRAEARCIEIEADQRA